MKKRKTNKGKQVDRTCSNNGSCPGCRGNRTHSNEKRKPAQEKDDDVPYMLHR